MPPANLTLEQIQTNFPFPWREFRGHHGEVFMVDATNKRVDLFYITGFCSLMTNAVRKKEENAPV